MVIAAGTAHTASYRYFHAVVTGMLEVWTHAARIQPMYIRTVLEMLFGDLNGMSDACQCVRIQEICCNLVHNSCLQPSGTSQVIRLKCAT